MNSLDNGLPRNMVEWLEDVQSRVVYLFHKLHMFNAFQEVYTSNPELEDLDATFFDETTKSYIQSCISLIYRLCDIRKDTKSLVNFLEEIKQSHSEVLTRERHNKLYGEGKERLAQSTFDRLAGVHSNQYSTKRIEELKADLRDNDPIKSIIQFRHNYVAHWKRRPPSKPKFRKIIMSVERIGEIYQEIRVLLTAENPGENLTPQPQFAWRKPFELPWLTDENREHFQDTHDNFLEKK